jgi:DNA adenine methylase
MADTRIAHDQGLGVTLAANTMEGDLAHRQIAADMDEPESLRPPLKWAGGKRWQVPHLRPLWSPHSSRRLVELFCGGLAVSLGLQPTEALLNDVNPHVVNFYNWVQRGLVVDIVMRNSDKTYYAYRERFNALLGSGKVNTAEAASLFYYLNKTGFNGLCRFNQQGRFNVPFGTFKSVNYLREFGPYRRAFSRWTFTSMDFQSVPLRPDDFVYADPPYDVEFTRYAKQVFGWDEQVRLARWLATHPGPVVLSNQATSRVLSLYRDLGFRTKLVDAPRSISCDGNRAVAREVLATRNLGDEDR